MGKGSQQVFGSIVCSLVFFRTFTAQKQVGPKVNLFGMFIGRYNYHVCSELRNKYDCASMIMDFPEKLLIALGGSAIFGN